MLQVGVACDFTEELWPSMDLVGDMLLREFATGVGNLQATRLRPKLRRSFTAVPIAGRSKLARNADRLLNRAVLYPYWLRRRKLEFDVIHVLDHSYAQLAWHTEPRRTVVSCHDLDAFSCILENSASPRSKWFQLYSRHVLTGLQRAAHIVCVSETVRRSLICNGLVDPVKVSVVYNGVDPTCCPEPSAGVDDYAETLLPFSKDTPLLLHVGSTVPRKRIDLLLRIFSKVLRKSPGAKLVRVGGPLSFQQMRQAAELQVADAIVQLPFLSREVLASVYRRCHVVLLPSEAEGFCLPIIEAMACGCPVIASDIPVLREVGGQGASFVPLEDVPQWAEAASALMAERRENLGVYAKRRERGLVNARRFDWRAAACRLSEIYRRVASS